MRTTDRARTGTTPTVAVPQSDRHRSPLETSERSD
ncbi:hypothetical protein STSP_68380 [Streptomyces jeddahensis]|uniref:Uncharacterized protein n=1 Tax=Streptomyces jeddahensis TaxID=1716141 RepID=A0A177HGX5_9ACTN|nr:hypothetical protein STSP_68380 [Streptomyces jeddahensis]